MIMVGATLTVDRHAKMGEGKPRHYGKHFTTFNLSSIDLDLQKSL